MITNKFSTPKYLIIILVFITGLVACEKDFKDIGIALVDNSKFDTKSLVSDIIAYNIKVDSVRVDSLPQYVIGVNLNNTFGKTTASLATQVSLPAAGVDFGENPILDSVILDIPYYNTKTDVINIKDPNSTNDTDSLTVPVYELDSIIGNQNTPFTINVYELGTFLNTLDPENPTKLKHYYSNKSFSTVNAPLYSGLFTPNANDTATIITYRNELNKIVEIDTIKRSGAIPSIKLTLNKSFFKDNFIDLGNTSDFSSTDDFTHFFRGLYITASGSDGSLITFPINNASVNLYYSNDVTSTDANEVTTTTRTTQKMFFPLIGIHANKFEHDYSMATSAIQTRLLNPDKANGEQKLYVQGASGSRVILNLFTNDDVENIRSKNWLLNEANIKLYIDTDESGSNLPSRLFLYNYDDNAHVQDIISEGEYSYGGTLEYDDNGDPEFYKFKITDYMASVLKQDYTRKVARLAIKSYSSFDVPRFLNLSDTIIKPFNWNPKGVAIFGNKELSAKKLKLEIFYTEPKN